MGSDKLSSKAIYDQLLKTNYDPQGSYSPVTWSGKKRTGRDLVRVYQVQSPRTEPYPGSDWFELLKE